RAQCHRVRALPGAAGRGHVEHALADGAAHGEAVEGELLLRPEVVDDASARHRDVVDDDRLLHRRGRAGLLARRDVERRRFQLDRSEWELLEAAGGAAAVLQALLEEVAQQLLAIAVVVLVSPSKMLTFIDSYIVLG